MGRQVLRGDRGSPLLRIHLFLTRKYTVFSPNWPAVALAGGDHALRISGSGQMAVRVAAQVSTIEPFKLGDTDVRVG